ncbi:hypothetical protein QR674_00990 [Acinetobacter chinensis]|uniref:DUF4209 domain-containing protein n=1 Tax=Acinetobacter chinensis TaxID=2004650 RepID=A0ABU3WAY7_9GAMM|nr:hypothetical protein [Acinetobacter chinensis]MDV2467565.1 hypothetical protein [Acinetobacter chinensis]
MIHENTFNNDTLDDDFDDESGREVTRIPQNKNAKKQLENNILKQAERYLEDIAEDEHAYLQKSLHQLAEQEPYFDVLADELNQELDAKVANDALYLLDFWQEIHEAEDLKKFSLLNVINEQRFQADFFEVFEALEIGENKALRKNVIEEAFKLYELGFYTGCAPILYAQLEGLLTDVLIQHGYLKQQDTKFVDVYKIVPGLKGNEIKSLWHKAKIAHELNPYFSELAAYKMDNSSTVTATRHNILHGTELNHFNQGRCFVLWVWLFSAVNFMRTVRS